MSFYNRQYAEEYDRRLAREGYPGKIITLLMKHLEGCTKILDIGAGSGFIAIPLAEAGKTVTAIEPSAEMLRLFQMKVAGRQLNIRFMKATWEEWSGKKRDAAISVHSLYPMKDPSRAIQKMADYTDRVLLLVRAESTSRTLSHEIRKAAGKVPSGRVSAEMMDDLLDDLGFYYHREDFIQERITEFTDIDSEIEYYMRHLDIDESMREEVRKIIDNYCPHNGTGFENKTVFHDFLYVIKKPE